MNAKGKHIGITPVENECAYKKNKIYIISNVLQKKILPPLLDFQSILP